MDNFIHDPTRGVVNLKNGSHQDILVVGQPVQLCQFS